MHVFHFELIHEGRLRYEGSLDQLQGAHAGAGLRDIFLELTGDLDEATA